MPQPQPRRHRLHTARTLKTSAVGILLMVALFAFVAAIDRSNWFHLRPASGTAAAMHHASAPAPTSSGEPAAAPVRP